MRTKSVISIFTAIIFAFSLTVFTSCSSGKKGHSSVKSGSGMGNKSHKNKHVWGK